MQQNIGRLNAIKAHGGVAIATGSSSALKAGQSPATLTDNIFISQDHGSSWYMAAKPANAHLSNITATGITAQAKLFAYSYNLTQPQLYSCTNLVDFEPFAANLFLNILDIRFNGQVGYLAGVTPEDAAGIEKKLMKSYDGGVTWTALPVSFSDDPTRVAVSSQNKLIVAGPACTSQAIHGFMKQSLDGGQNWTDLFSDDYVSPSSIAYVQNRILLFGRNQLAGSAHLFISNDDGVSFDEILLPQDSIAIASMPDNEKIWLFGGGSQAMIYKSDINLSQWEAHALAMAPIVFARVAGNAAWLTTNELPQKIYKVELNTYLVELVYTVPQGFELSAFDFSNENSGWALIKKPVSTGYWYDTYLVNLENKKSPTMYGPYRNLMQGVTMFYGNNGMAYGDYGSLLALGNGYPLISDWFYKNEYEVYVFPNPAHSHIKVQFKAVVTDWQFNLYDCTGKLVFSGLFYGNSVEIALPCLVSGIYSWEIKSQANLYVGKVLIE